MHQIRVQSGRTNADCVLASVLRWRWPAFGCVSRKSVRLLCVVRKKKLGLNQAQAGQLFGGGATAFSDYDRGKTQPHKSTLLLLKLLDRHPDLLEELAG